MCEARSDHLLAALPKREWRPRLYFALLRPSAISAVTSPTAKPEGALNDGKSTDLGTGAEVSRRSIKWNKKPGESAGASLYKYDEYIVLLGSVSLLRA